MQSLKEPTNAGVECDFSTSLAGHCRMLENAWGAPSIPTSPRKRLLLSVILFLLCLTTGRTASITLVWDASNGSNMTYKVYQSVGTQPFNPIMAVTATTATVAGISTNQPTRFFVTGYSTRYDPPETAPSNIVTNQPTATPPTVLGLNFEAESGTIAAPFYVTNGLVQQDIQTESTSGGRASYVFNVTNAGNYTVTVMVNAPNDSADSFFVNIDGEPTEANIWDVPITAGIQPREVLWRGETNAHVFALTQTQHLLVIRGREPGAQLDRISIVPTTPPPTPLPGPPPAPKNLRAVQVTGRRYDLQWLSDPMASTEAEQSIKSEPFVNIGTVPPGTMHLTVQLNKRREYTFRTRGTNAIGVSPYSNLAVVVPP